MGLDGAGALLRRNTHRTAIQDLLVRVGENFERLMAEHRAHAERGLNFNLVRSNRHVKTVRIRMTKSATRRLILILCILALSGAEVSPVRGEPPRFVTVAPGIAHATFQMRPADAEPFSGHAFKIDLDVAELRLVPAGGPRRGAP